MEYVVYVDTSIARIEQVIRSYVQRAGSTGLSNPTGWGPMAIARPCMLDSDVMLFNNQAQAEKFTKDLATTYSDYASPFTFGYHGITESGNACKPFVTVRRASPNVGEDVEARYKHHIALNDAYAEFEGYPHLLSRRTVAVGRDADLTLDDVTALIQPILANLVEEELDQVLAEIDSWVRMGGWFTGVDVSNHTAIIHRTKKTVGGEHRHSSLAITALNCFTDVQIKEIIKARQEGVYARSDS